MSIQVKSHRRGKAIVKAYTRTDTEKKLKARHDFHQRTIELRPGAERIPPLPKRRGGRRRSVGKYRGALG